MIIEGAIAVKAALLAHKREVYKVYMDQDKKTKDFNYLRFLIKDLGISLCEIKREELEKIAQGKTHGGILAEVSARLYQKELRSNKDIFYIDGIEDPFNFGYICRTLYAFGIEEIIVADRDFTNMEATILKSSAGAFEYLNIIKTTNPLETIQTLKTKSYYTYALYRGEGSHDLFETSFKKPSLFLIGGEKRGISSKILKEVDEYLYIPYGQDFKNALNASSAISVVATLLFKQRKDHD